MRISRATPILIALVAGATAVAAPAQAAGYDPTPLCASATPTGAQLGTALSTIRTNTRAAAGAAGGLTIDAAQKGFTAAYRLDAADRRSRTDISAALSPFTFWSHDLVDVARGASYTGHLATDGRDEKAALALLKKKSEVWTAATDSGPGPLTVDDLVDLGLDQSAFGGLVFNSTDAAVKHAFGCSVDPEGRLVLTDRFSFPGLTVTGTHTYSFTDTGALVAIAYADRTNGLKSPAYTEAFGYSAVEVALPTSTATPKAWDVALVQAGFANLQADTVKAVKAKVAAQKTKAKRVAALRAVAAAQVKTYQQGTATTTKVTNGVTVKAAKAYSKQQHWSFTLTVQGTKLKLTSNLP